MAGQNVGTGSAFTGLVLGTITGSVTDRAGLGLAAFIAVSSAALYGAYRLTAAVQTARHKNFSRDDSELYIGATATGGFSAGIAAGTVLRTFALG